jgi:hypothetical protein
LYWERRQFAVLSRVYLNPSEVTKNIAVGGKPFVERGIDAVGQRNIIFFFILLAIKLSETDTMKDSRVV